ncbi:hypothetical protein, partial [Rhodovulum sp. PH10]|uniref:hypothetical protein n=1 Tax=Rhodovulum sp. PH10 TaxID=1187851 RepID=UPI00058ABD99
GSQAATHGGGRAAGSGEGRAKPARAGEGGSRPPASGANMLVEKVRAAYGRGKPASGKGFNLDLSAGGPDVHDHDFERAS